MDTGTLIERLAIRRFIREPTKKDRSYSRKIETIINKRICERRDSKSDFSHWDIREIVSEFFNGKESYKKRVLNRIKKIFYLLPGETNDKISSEACEYFLPKYLDLNPGSSDFLSDFYRKQPYNDHNKKIVTINTQP